MRNVPTQWLAAVVVVSLMLGIGVWYNFRWAYYRYVKLYPSREALIRAYGLEG